MFDIIGKRNWFFLFSGLILVPGLIFIALTPISNGKEGLQFSVDYTGGTIWEIKFVNPDASAADLARVLEANDIVEPEISKDTAGYFKIRMKETNLLPAPTLVPTATPAPSLSPGSSASPSTTATPAATASSTASASASPSASPTPSPTATPTPVPTPTATPLPSGCVQRIPQVGPLAKIAVAIQADPKLGPIQCTREQSTVGAIVSNEMIQQTILLILLGTVGMLAWIALRFQSFKFGTTAVVAVFHDVIVVIGIFAVLGSIFRVQIDSLFVTAMLTVIGFSVHDTIVVFDRIRENKTRHAGEPFDQIVNHSVLQTFGRSINTSFTVVLTLTALLLFAGASIQYFVLALLIGIISGTYSSIFNASTLLVVWQLRQDRRKAEQLALARSSRRR
jgi:preprotein translocase subunit SecF